MISDRLSNFLYGPVKIAAIDSTSDVDTYILTGNVKKQYLFSQISMTDVNIQDDILLSCHENMAEIRLTNDKDRKLS